MKRSLLRVFCFCSMGLLTGQGWAADYYVGESPTTYIAPNQNQLNSFLQDVQTNGAPIKVLNELVHPVKAVSDTAILTASPIILPPAITLPMSAETSASGGIIRQRHRRPLRKPTVITQCTAITAPGNYVLGADLESAGPCLSMLGVHDVNLDCAGHTISSTRISIDLVVNIQNAQNISMNSCSIYGPTMKDQDGKPFRFPSLNIRQSENVQVTGSTIDGVDIIGLTGGKFTRNRISGFYQQRDSSYMFVSNNVINGYKDAEGAGALISADGHDNWFTNNNIDGGWNGDPANYLGLGSDDGIILDNESNDTVTGNTIQNVWDAGIEPVGTLTNSVISNNTISHCLVTAIGSYWDTSWVGNTIANNQASDAQTLLLIHFTPILPFSKPTTIYFQDNRFENNVLTSRLNVFSPYFPTSHIAFTYFDRKLNPGLPSFVQFVASNNLVKGNDFGRDAPPPFLYPAGAFVDGGGNICQPGPQTVVTCQ